MARTLIDRAEPLARLTLGSQKSDPAAAPDKGASRNRRLGRAEALVSPITDPYCQVEVLFDLTRAVADAGDFEKALGFAVE